MNKVADATRVSSAKAVKLAGDLLQRGVTGAAPSRLRNVGKSGGRLGVTVRTTGGDHPTSTGVATGPWAIIEYDTPKHLIGVGKSSRKRARVRVVDGAAQGGYLKGAGYAHGVRGPVVHPGTKGKLLFHKGVAGATPAATAVMAKTTVQAVKEAFS